MKPDGTGAPTCGFCLEPLEAGDYLEWNPDAKLRVGSCCRYAVVIRGRI